MVGHRLSVRLLGLCIVLVPFRLLVLGDPYYRCHEFLKQVRELFFLQIC